MALNAQGTMMHIAHTRSAGTKVTWHLVHSLSIYVKLIYPRMKMTFDNSEGRVQAVCHKIWDLNLFI